MRPITTSLTDASGGAKQSAALPMDIYARPTISVQLVITGTASATVQQTLDNIFDPTVTPTWFNHPDAGLVNATANVQGRYDAVPRAVRLVLNSGTGTAKLTLVQTAIAT